MNRRLLDDVVDDADQSQVDSEVIIDRFTEMAAKYVEEADDPTVDQVEVLLVHFADSDPDDLDEETLSLLWVMESIMTWMIESLPLQGELENPDWLQERLDYLESYGIGGQEPDLDVDMDTAKSRFKKLIDDIAQDQDNGAPKRMVMDRVSDIGIDPDEAEDVLRILMMRGEVVEVEPDRLETEYYD